MEDLFSTRYLTYSILVQYFPRQADNASTTSITATMEIPICYVFGLALDHEVPCVSSLIGSIFIVVGIVILATGACCDCGIFSHCGSCCGDSVSSSSSRSKNEKTFLSTLIRGLFNCTCCEKEQKTEEQQMLLTDQADKTKNGKTSK